MSSGNKYTLKEAQEAFDCLYWDLFSVELRDLQESLDYEALHKQYPDLKFDEGCLADDEQLLQKQLDVCSEGHSIRNFIILESFLNSIKGVVFKK